MAQGAAHAMQHGEGGYIAEWRERVNRELESASQANQATAVILERLKNQIDEHDDRLKRLELSPASLRSTFGTYGGCIGQVMFAALSSLGVLISVASLIIVLTRGG